ncbi:MAG: anaerobic sulfatase maturase [Candidatus Omnitrophica bacterium]|nr:anaerobic sulfatase maturase [Candidatus Omnitrophota bacterium]
MRKVELLIKPVSYLCNLGCTYCFYKKTAKIYKNPSVMSPDVLEKFISRVMEYSSGGHCLFSWQGGEPLLAGIDFYRRAVEFQSKYGRNGQPVGNTVQTNGLLIDGKFIDLFKKYRFFIGVSLDGPLEIHNFYRKYPSGRGTFREVMSKIRLLERNGAEFNILSTVGEETAKYPEKIYRFFVSEGFKFLQFIPAVDRKSGRMKNFSIRPETYGTFLCRMFDLWWNGGRPVVSVRFFDNIIEVLLGLEPGACSLKKQCGEYLVVEHNGDVYPCDFFVDAQFKLGNLLETSLEELFKKAKEDFGKLKEVSVPECDNCQWGFICNKGCLWFRRVNKGNLLDRDYLCEAYRKFFPYAIERLKMLASNISAKRPS